MIEGSKLSIGYEEKIIVNDFDISISEGEFVSLIGPNGSGKSTILKCISGLLKQKDGVVNLDGEDLASLDTKKVAKKLSILSQHNQAPDDITVEDLIYYGRMPHKKCYESKTSEDEDIVKWAIEQTNLEGYETRRVSDLSGGERQRVWLALALAQQPKVLLLDEPTTYLDICHQLEVLELVKKLCKNLNITVITVLHDLNQAAKYSDRVIVLQKGQKVVEGKPKEVFTNDMIREVYNVESNIIIDKDDKPVISVLDIASSYKERCVKAC